jgi:hypothetical protein
MGVHKKEREKHNCQFLFSSNTESNFLNRDKYALGKNQTGEKT